MKKYSQNKPLAMRIQQMWQTLDVKGYLAWSDFAKISLNLQEVEEIARERGMELVETFTTGRRIFVMQSHIRTREKLPCGLLHRDLPRCAHGNACYLASKCKAALREQEITGRQPGGVIRCHANAQWGLGY